MKLVHIYILSTVSVFPPCYFHNQRRRRTANAGLSRHFSVSTVGESGLANITQLGPSSIQGGEVSHASLYGVLRSQWHPRVASTCQPSGHPLQQEGPRQRQIPRLLFRSLPGGLRTLRVTQPQLPVRHSEDEATRMIRER